MRPLSEFELHVVCPEDWAPPEAWMVFIHKSCGAPLVDGAALGEWDMLDLEAAVDLAVDHKCE